MINQTPNKKRTQILKPRKRLLTLVKCWVLLLLCVSRGWLAAKYFFSSFFPGMLLSCNVIIELLTTIYIPYLIEKLHPHCNDCTEHILYDSCILLVCHNICRFYTSESSFLVFIMLSILSIYLFYLVFLCILLTFFYRKVYFKVEHPSTYR